MEGMSLCMLTALQIPCSQYRMFPEKAALEARKSGCRGRYENSELSWGNSRVRSQDEKPKQSSENEPGSLCFASSSYLSGKELHGHCFSTVLWWSESWCWGHRCPCTHREAENQECNHTGLSLQWGRYKSTTCIPSTQECLLHGGVGNHMPAFHPKSQDWRLQRTQWPFCYLWRWPSPIFLGMIIPNSSLPRPYERCHKYLISCWPLCYQTESPLESIEATLMVTIICQRSFYMVTP